MLALIVWALLRASEGNAGYEMNVYKESPGVYFANLGHAIYCMDHHSVCTDATNRQ
jgi:hypothetical protein